jgi:pyruvate/2-oxoglutarate dehydrogenase complex dihydrolipoamide acyltransferase (E2) component
MATETGRGDVSYEDPSRLQRNLVRRVAESKATAPDLVLSHEVDIEAAHALGHAVEHVVVKAAALALRDVPRVNGAYRDGRFERYGRVNIGLVVDAQGALGEAGGVGEPTPRPVVRDGAVTIRRTSELTLTCDHRLLYGPEAAAFLRAVDAHLQAL